MHAQAVAPLTHLEHRHLLGLEDYSAAEIELILEAARYFRQILERPVKKVPTLRDRTVVNLFFEPSTRTRISFELAERRLSADVVSFQAAGSSLSKGETLRDTARNLEAMKIDMLVVRHWASGVPHQLARWTSAQIINAGDGAHEHPTQALLDLYTLQERFGRIRGLRVAIVGDIAHSRVARSNIHGLRKLGASVIVCGPPTLLPAGIETLGVDVTTNLEEALKGAHAVIALRLQRERQQSGLLPSLREYHFTYGIRAEHLERYPDLVILHPGPINRGVELADEVADSPQAVILDQVTNGVAVRMAVLYLLAGMPKPETLP
ncbi:MAG: aspartate carbamoyltransferase catalytic subunit [Bacteroidetes bacterium]|nr:aspartate carbamoyltransferase catalytic subunit [Rhodothermia bacterium]MCS7155464.1 aspartate carbamoyltransferase catalytic subunit [Bacteroidota bacterium]MCX7907443.1 aspartate carbamoyltransferase catalytic subunit [Bacteroidota bacterium]MDW8138437.1 aspartate carbamoyltransferase catalytic subunit [Bacteroidota bacterium]MDW8284626.1 aspartate carbamoyltransferase catalytic subunit [Bacteroidota bacterium]